MATVAERAALTPLERRAVEELASAARGAHCGPCPRCWNRWVRHRTMEHLAGEQYWAELDRGDFGLLRVTFHPNARLAAEIVARVAHGAENLTVIDWVLDAGGPICDAVAILTVLDINARRIPRFWFLDGAIAADPTAIPHVCAVVSATRRR